MIAAGLEAGVAHAVIQLAYYLLQRGQWWRNGGDLVGVSAVSGSSRVGWLKPEGGSP